METIFYTVRQIAETLSLTEETIREKFRKGELEGIKIGKSWRMEGSKLRRFLNVNADKEI